VNLAHRLLLRASLAAALLAAPSPLSAAAKEARVTQIIRDVKLLPSEAEARPAVMNDRVQEDTAVRTGDKSRSELTFADLTINRLGANSVFSFNKGGRSLDLSGGSVLLRAPKDSSGGSIRTPAVSVAVTGTTIILETARGGRSKLLVLEGGARLALVKYPAQNRRVEAGQMLDVPAGATTLPMPVNIDLDQVMNSHPLIVGFPPLPSRNLIFAAAEKQRAADPDGERVYQGQPVAGSGPTGGIGIPGISLPGISIGGGGGRSSPNNPSGTGRPTRRGKAASQPPNPNNPNSPGGR